MIRREAKFQTLFRHWLKANPTYSAAFELKQTTTNNLLFSAVQKHQLNGLLAVTKPQGILYKLPDDSRGIKPFDMMHLALAYAYIVIRYPKLFVIITVENFISEKERSHFLNIKSLTSERACEIAETIVKLK